jgi:hypothetical protein
VFNVGSIGGNLTPPTFYFSSINPGGALLNTTDSVNVTLRVNMGPATREVDPFVYATDTVRLLWEDALSRFAQVRTQGSFPQSVIMSRVGPSDSVYQTTFKVKGRAHYNMQYHYRYSQPDLNQYTEGGGLGIQNPYRSRFIQPLSPNTFPPNYTAPLDAWQQAAPLPAEPPPYPVGPTSVEEDPSGGLPSAYRLSQNYPNPFNPSTRIRYNIPVHSRVSLKVFNLLGQEVASLVNEEQPAGRYIALFEANSLPTGVYFYRLEAGSFRETKKMLLVR